MWILYIDDSFFTTGEFAQSMRYKLRVLVQEMTLDTIWISASKTSEEKIRRFFQERQDLHLKLSTARISSESREWILSNSSLSSGDVCIRPYAGTYCLVNTETGEYERLYLDLFPQEETDLQTLMVQAMQAVIERWKNPSKKMKS